MIEIYRGYQVKPHKLYPGSLIIALDGKGGTIPKVMGTLYTSRGLAKEAIDKYLDTPPVIKEKTYASKTKPTGGDK